MQNNWSLSRRLVVGAAVWSLILLLITATLLTVLNRNQALQLLHDEVDATLLTLTRAVDIDDKGVTVARNFAPSDERFVRPLSGRYWIVARLNADQSVEGYLNSNSVWDWNIPWDEFPIQETTEQLGQTVYQTVTGPDNEPVRLGSKAVVLPGLREPVLLVSGVDRRPTDKITRNFLITLTVAMSILAIGLTAAMAVLVRVGLRPLSRIEQDVSAIRAGDKEKIDESYPIEVAPLAHELNKLLDHNKNVVDRARTHVGNLAHALKTPIAVLMNEAQGDDEFSQLVRRQTDMLSQNVQHYLKRAQAAARAEIMGTRTEVAPAIDDLTRLLNRLFEEKGLSVAPGYLDESLCFRGERQDLDEMLGNLLENACKFAKLKVRATAEKTDNGEVAIHVDDDGPGLTPSEREEALKRGVRLDETAPGTGLGLSIVTDLAELYSGRFELHDSPLGGLRATLILPLAHSK